MPGQVIYYKVPAVVPPPAVEEGYSSRIRLRLHFRGVFSRVPDEQTWRYSGGEVFNESFPVSFKYAELCRKLNDKFSDTVSFKYQAPGEELDPEGLVAVTDDDDLQELYEEYFQALNRPGTPQKTFRIRVFVFPALQFETLYNNGGGLETMEDSINDGEEPGINFESWCSDDLSESSNLSGNPSMDTAMQDPKKSQPALEAEFLLPSQLHSDSMLMSPIQLKAATDTCFKPTPHDHLPAGFTQTYPDRKDHEGPDEGVALQGLQNVHQALSGFQIAPEDFGLDDPYHEQDEEEQHMQNGGKDKHGDKAQAEDTSLFNKPLLRVRENSGWGNLPSHISVFGDEHIDSGQDAAAAGGADGTSFKLPSQISAFGDGPDSQDGGDLLSSQPREAGAVLGALQPLHGEVGGVGSPANAYALHKRRNSKVVTQEFSSQGNDDEAYGGNSLLRLDDQWEQGERPSHGTSNFQTHNNKQNLLEVVTRVPRESVKIVAKIGEGAFGEVSQALVFPYGSVAVKWLKRDRFAKYLDSFQREAEVLAKLNHPNIIRMYGLVTEPAPPGSVSKSSASSSSSSTNGSAFYEGRSEGSDSKATLIAGIMTEYVRGGSLSQHLRSYRNVNRRLSLKERCLIAWQATLGMAYLHDQSPAIIHFDLKPDNLLVEGEGDNLSVKVADFGLSKHKFQSFVSCRDLRGTLPYMAPELVNNPNQVCEKCDVWSMGVVMWELYTLEVPFQELSAQQILMGLMDGRLNLQIPYSCEPEWHWLVEWCMEVHPTKRPSFKQLATKLEAILRQI
eukprot:gene15484-21569_t